MQSSYLNVSIKFKKYAATVKFPFSINFRGFSKLFQKWFQDISLKIKILLS